MHGTYTLAKPVVASLVGATETATLPSGACLEVPHNAHTALVVFIWQYRSFIVHLPDLLDACRVEDIGAITLLDRWENSSPESD
jgi:hypothetical protein